MNPLDPRWKYLFETSWVVSITLTLVFWIGLVWVCVSLYRTHGFRSLRWLGAYCGISALGSVATFVSRMVRPPAQLMPFSLLMAVRVLAPTILNHAAHFLVAIMILSEIAVLVENENPETKSKLIGAVVGINERVETCGLVLVVIATISFALSILWLGGG